MENSDHLTGNLDSIDSFEKELAWCIQKLKKIIGETNKTKCNFYPFLDTVFLRHRHRTGLFYGIFHMN
jgi:hypothetical protein